MTGLLGLAQAFLRIPAYFVLIFVFTSAMPLSGVHAQEATSETSTTSQIAEQETKPDGTKSSETSDAKPEASPQATDANKSTNGEQTTADTAPAVTPGMRLKLSCQTDGLGIGHAPPKSSKGPVGLEVDIGDDTKPGQWSITSYDTKHSESFATYLKKNGLCSDGCPLRLTTKNGIELWAPKPLSIDKLNKNDLLVIITLNDKTLELKSSTFQGTGDGAQPLVFEKGTCEKTP